MRCVPFNRSTCEVLIVRALRLPLCSGCQSASCRPFPTACRSCSRCGIPLLSCRTSRRGRKPDRPLRDKPRNHRSMICTIGRISAGAEAGGHRWRAVSGIPSRPATSIINRRALSADRLPIKKTGQQLRFLVDAGPQVNVALIVAAFPFRHRQTRLLLGEQSVHCSSNSRCDSFRPRIRSFMNRWQASPNTHD